MEINSLPEIISDLDKDAEQNYKSNLEFAKLIIKNQKDAVNYYIGPFGRPIIDRIQNTIVHREIISEYYEFLALPVNDKGDAPTWHKVSLYCPKEPDGHPKSKLATYTTFITVRHFYKLAIKEKNIKNNKDPLLDFKDYESLLEYDRSEEADEKISLLRRAYDMLNERDQIILEMLLIDKLPAIRAFEEVEEYIHPIPHDGMTSDEIKAGWTITQKQNAISLLKGRAIKKLINNYNSLLHEDDETN